MTNGEWGLVDLIIKIGNGIAIDAFIIGFVLGGLIVFLIWRWYVLKVVKQ